jgi:hypothetical protein
MANGFRVALNGKEIVTVSTEGMLMLCVRVGGTRVDADGATYDISGMTAGPDETPAGHPWWALCEPLRAGDELRIDFISGASTSRPPIDDPAEQENEPRHGPMPPREELVAWVAKELVIHDSIKFQFTDDHGQVRADATLPTEHGMGFSVLWNWMHKDRANVSLHCYDLDYLAEKNPGRELARFKITPGRGVALKVE